MGQRGPEGSRFDPEAKKERHREQFPLECKKAYELGARLVRQGK